MLVIKVPALAILITFCNVEAIEAFILLLNLASISDIMSCNILHQNAVRSGLFCYEKNESTKIDGRYCQPEVFRNLAKGMQAKELWNQPNLLSEEMVRCMKNIYRSLADSDKSMKSSVGDSQHSAQSPCEHLPDSLRWSSSEHSTTSSSVQSPLVDVKDCDVLASGNASDPYHVRGKLSWADIGSYGSAVEVSWMSVGKNQLEYAAGALRRFR